MNNKVLVTGATGTVGKAVIRQLQSLQTDFVAGVRDVEKAKSQLGLTGQQATTFDFSDPSTFPSATEGVTAVFLLGPPLVMHLDALLAPFLEYLKTAGIRRVVYLSALGADNMGPDLAFHAIMEEKLAAGDFDFTILKPSFFAQNFKNYEWENITQRGITFVPAGTGKVAFVDVEDIAAVAAAALTQEGHTGKTYRITGPELISYPEAAQILSGVTGKTIVYPNPSPEEYTAALKAAGAPDFIAPYMIDVYSIIGRNQAEIMTDDVEKVTGKKATPLKEVLERDFK